MISSGNRPELLKNEQWRITSQQSVREKVLLRDGEKTREPLQHSSTGQSVRERLLRTGD